MTKHTKSILKVSPYYLLHVFQFFEMLFKPGAMKVDMCVAVEIPGDPRAFEW